MSKIVGIYKITSPSKKIYIGQSVNVEKRFKQYRRLDCKSQRKLHRSFLKHGVESHLFEIVCQCEVGELNEREMYYVDLHQSFNTSHGLNLKSGGSANGRHSDETKAKIGAANRGKIRTEDAKKLNRERQKGEKSPRYGKKLSKDHANNISKSLMGHKVSDDVRIRISICRRKPIDQYTLEFEFIKRHDSTLAAAAELNVNPLGISACLNGRSKKSHGFVWKKVSQEK